MRHAGLDLQPEDPQQTLGRAALQRCSIAASQRRRLVTFSTSELFRHRGLICSHDGSLNLPPRSLRGRRLFSQSDEKES